MANSSFSLILGILLEVLESHSSDSLLSRFLNIFCLICYFFQSLSYLVQISFNYEEKRDFFFDCFYYTNFANFLTIFKSRELVIVVYAGVITIIFVFFIYLSFIVLLKIYFKVNWKSKLFFKIGNTIAANFFRLYFWILLVPFLEILVNPFNCKSGSFLHCGDELPQILWVLSGFSIVLSIILGLFHLLINYDYKFLDFMEIRIGLNVLSLASFIIRCMFPLASILIGQNDYVLILLLHLFAVLNFVNYIETFPIRSSSMSSFYFSSILSFEVVVIIVTFWKYFGVLVEESIIYLIMFGWVFSFKMGWNYLFRRRMSIFLSNFSYPGLIDYELEELFYLINNTSESSNNFFLLSGILQIHAKVCTNPMCKLKSKTMKKFETLPLIKKIRIVDSFIIQRFKKEIEQQSKFKTRENEKLVFKYISYLITSHCNTSKTFYETQKIRLLYTSRSFLGEILLAGLFRQVEKNIRDIEREKAISQRKNLDQSLEVSSFFRINRQKVALELNLNKLLETKINFWENYKDGFKSYDDITKELFRFFKQANSFRQQIEELLYQPVLQHKKITLFRFMSIYHCIVLNQLSEALSFEEQIETIRKRFLHVDKQALSPLVFLSENLVTCEASFLNSDGTILESSKNEKLAKFFGYSIHDVKLLKNVCVLMPQFIAENHTNLIFRRFRQTRKEQISSELEILTHAADKQGFLFPVKLFISSCFHYAEDYVINTGIMRLQEHGYEEVFIGPSGDVLGYNREFFEFFHQNFQKLDSKQLQGLYLYSLMPRLEEILEKEEIFKDQKTIAIRNQIVSLTIPDHLIDIIELMSYFKMECEELDNNNSKNGSRAGNLSSLNTFRTNRSTFSNNQNKSRTLLSKKQNKDLMIRVNNFLNKLESFQSKREMIMSLFQDHTITSKNLMTNLVENQSGLRLICTLDLNFKYYRYGNAPDQVISIAQIIFVKINRIESEDQALKSHHIEESKISDKMEKPLILPPKNQVELLVNLPNCPQKESNHSSKENFEYETHEKQLKNPGEQPVLKDLELQGSQSSTSNTGKAVSNILAMVGVLRKTLPKEIYRLNYLLVLQMFLVLIFCIVYYILAGQYISYTYVPMKTALSNQLIINTAITVSSTTFVNIENQILGFKNLSDFELNEMFAILTQKYQIATNLFYQDRNTPEKFGFSNYLQNWRLTYVDGQTFKASNTLLVDETDVFLDVINKALKIQNLKSMKELVKILPRNYIDYLISSKALRDVILAEFVSSNQGVTNQLLIVLISAALVVFLCKLLEYALFSFFYSKLARLLNVFLRNSAKDAINEILFLKKILESIKNQTKTFLSVSYSEYLLNKQNYALPIEEDNLINTKNKGKQIKKANKAHKRPAKTRSAIAGLHPFSKTTIYLLLFISGGSIILYFSFNYYFWTQSNQSINDLLSPTEVMNNLYVFSSTVPCFNNLLLREIIKRDLEYEASKAKFQIHANRLSQLTFLLDSRTQFLETYIRQLPTYILIAENQLNDKVFTQIIEGDLCAVLELKGLINDVGRSHCSIFFDGAMLKGILGALNNYINHIKAIRGLCNITGVTTDAQKAQKDSDVRNFIKSQAYSEIAIGSVYINNALMVFYEYFSEYYLSQLYKSINQLSIFVWIMCVACLTGMTLLLVYTWSFSKRVYGLATGGLDLIPLEKLSFDEQTIFLIKSFCKDQI